MSTNPEDQDAAQAVEDKQAEAYFDEFAGDGPATPDPEHGDDRARDDQGRFSPQDDNSDAEDDNLDEPGDESRDGRQADGQPTDDGGQDGNDDPAAELDRLRQEAQQWQHRYQSDLGRQNALQRKIQEQQQQIEQLQKRSPQDGSGAEGENPEGSGYSDAEWQSLKEDFPEVAQAIEKRISAVSSQYEQRIQDLQSQIQPIQQQAEVQALQAQQQALEAQHPGWQDTVKTPEFNDWLQQQPNAVQQLTSSSDAADAAFLLQSFKLSSGQSNENTQNRDLQNRRKRQLETARTVPNRGSRQRSKIPDDDPDALFDYYAERT